ncbi:hypothetical protein ANN_07041 [Periplaneta americana]|uniref:Transposase n=1 Tax=Periplaneta americana TaxID=6978 RepID=A0ABQ8TFF1_PERAM|nr:hypothetical protein ANN_07041 [Periplaneta americana]
MSPGSSTESYPAFARIGLRENPGKNLNQVIAFICGLIVVILMIMALASTDWLMAAGWRQGLFIYCVAEDAPLPLPFNKKVSAGCHPARDEAYIKAAAALCIITLLLDIVATVLTGLGLRSKDHRTKYMYYRVAVYIMVLSPELSEGKYATMYHIYFTQQKLCQIYGPNIMSKQMVRHWCRQFSEGRQSVHDEERSGRLSLINDDRVELMRQCIMENRCFTITELSSHFPQISRCLLHDIVTKHLLFKKVCARIVTGDETWISHFTPETKQQSMHWRHSGSPVRTKFKQTLSVRKVMCTVFWDRKGILLIDFLPRGEIVNADRYCETLRKLRRAIQNKRRGMLTAVVVLLHDNARPHTARRTAAVLTEFGWALFHHPPYSPDLAPSDFHVFLHLKKFLSSGERFGNDEELKTSVTRWFHSQAAQFYDRGIQKLIPRYDKCLNSDGGYVEK